MKTNLMKVSAAALLVFTATVSNQRVAVAADGWFECQPIEVTVFSSRVHIRCRYSFSESENLGFVPAFGDPRFFAVPASDVRLTSAAITLGQAAIISNRSILIDFDYYDSTGDAYGCRMVDCRPIRALRLEK